MTSFAPLDDQMLFYSASAQEIIQSLTKEDILTFFHTLNVNNIEDHGAYLICPTICHHSNEDEASMKLYWYNDSKLFHCFTQCGDTMNIFELYMRHMEQRGQHINFEQAKMFILHLLNHLIYNIEESNEQEEVDENQYEYKMHVPQLKEISSNVLDCFESYAHPLWIKDGISPTVMKNFNIRFWRGQNKIIIPHYDKDNRLIGIRARELEPSLIEQYGKYHPIMVGAQIYKHALSFNLYGLNKHFEGINRRHNAIIVEGEKSVLLDETYFGPRVANAVACCGGHLGDYQLALLIDNCDVNEIIIAMDKEFDNWNSIEAHKQLEELYKRYKPFTSQVKVYYIWDTQNLLNKKDSPYDKGIDVFNELYKNRIQLR